MSIRTQLWTLIANVRHLLPSMEAADLKYKIEKNIDNGYLITDKQHISEESWYEE